MAVDVNPSQLLSIGVVLLVLWRVYARARRMIGRQKLRRLRAWLTTGLFPCVVLALALASIGRPINLAALFLGAALGASLGVLGLRLTRFETTPEGLYYTPNAHLGMALSLLFIGRLAYRFLQLRLGGLPFSGPPDDLHRSPLTLLIFATLAGYYVVYAIGLLRWARSGQGDAVPGPGNVS